MKSRHRHPRPLLDKLTQYGALGVVAVLLLAASGQVILAIALSGGLLVLTALFTLAFAPFLLRLTASTPAVTLSEKGLAVEPLLWRAHFIPWCEVAAIKDYPLLPSPGGETTRKALEGRRHYRPAEGKMLLIPALPWQYRITGLLAGEGWTPVIAVTNRSHTEYDKLLKKLLLYYEEAGGANVSD